MGGPTSPKELNMAEIYFSELNYTLANEDTSIEWSLLPESVDSVFCIAGSGSRVLPLLAKKPKEIDIIDMSQEQLWMAELRIQSALNMSYEEWLFFMGYRLAIQDETSLPGESRWSLFQRLTLSEGALKYWSEGRSAWEKEGFINLGRWESHFAKLSALFRKGLRFDFSPIFEASEIEEQKSLYKKHWPQVRFQTFLRLVANEWVFNKYLYKGHFAGNDDHRTEKRSPWQFIDQEFRRVFETQLVRKGYFFQRLFLGGIKYEEGLPFEAHRKVFEAIQGFRGKINYHQGQLLNFLPKKEYDFISLSDTISYLDPDEANALLQSLSPQNKKGSLMVIRSFLRAPTKMNTEGWQVEVKSEKWAYDKDVTGVYSFHIFKKS
jgi:S-adenosylmethionine-diacylglycerol 3-amino-3-carboxypropyl transferase